MNLRILFELHRSDDVLAADRGVNAFLHGEMVSIPLSMASMLKKQFVSMSRDQGEIDLMRRLND